MYALVIAGSRWFSALKSLTCRLYRVCCRRATTSVGDNDEEGGSDMDTDDAQGGAPPGSRGRVSQPRYCCA
jgi:hypothetical protein